MYQSYFENMLSRIWLGDKKLDTGIKLEKTNVQDIYLEFTLPGRLIVLGKTEKYFFILEGINNDGFQYSNGLFNDDMASLINAYKEKEAMLNGASVDSFISSITLHTKLLKNLPSERISKVKKLKI